MSVWEVTDSPAKPTASPAERPQLQSVPGLKGARLRGLPFAAAVVTLLAGGMVGLLALNVHIQNQQMVLNKAQKQSAALALEVSDKQAQVYAKSGPGQLAAAASALGMVPNPVLVYVDLRTGQIVGTPKAVTGAEMPALRVQPSAEATPTATATVPVVSNVQPWFDLGKVQAAPTEQASPSASAKATATKSAAAKPSASAQPSASAAPTQAASTPAKKP